MKQKKKISRAKQAQLDAIKHCVRRDPIPAPAVFKSKKDYNRQRVRLETKRAWDEA
jgi:hypothetical protein